MQVLEYVADATAALAQMHRALRPGGRVVVWDVDWATVSWHSEAPGADGARPARWDEHLTHPSLPRTLAARLAAAGFSHVGAEGHVFATHALDPEAFGPGVVLPLVEQFVAGRPAVGADEARRGPPSSASWARAASSSSRAPSSASPRSASPSPRTRRYQVVGFVVV